MVLVTLEIKRTKVENLLAFLPPLFRKTHLDTLLQDPAYCAQVLNRMLKRRLVARITKGVYLNVLKCKFTNEWPPVEEAACLIKPAAYVSLEWALHYWNLILQRPAVCTAVVTKVGRLRRVSFKETLDQVTVEYEVEFSAISKVPRHFGIEGLPEIMARMATPERALLDWIHVRRPSEYTISSWIDEMEVENLNAERLLAFSQHYPPRVKRLVSGILDR